MDNPHKIEDKDITLTPLDLIKSLGEFDLDPCAAPKYNTAKNLILLPKDGLKEDWFGRIWLNPPYSTPSPWLERLAKHGNGIALVLASTGTKWFHNFIFNKANSILFLQKRPKFTRLDGSKVSIMRDVVLVGYGKENTQALEKCGLDGKLIYIL